MADDIKKSMYWAQHGGFVQSSLGTTFLTVSNHFRSVVVRMAWILPHCNSLFYNLSKSFENKIWFSQNYSSTDIERACRLKLYFCEIKRQLNFLYSMLTKYWINKCLSHCLKGQRYYNGTENYHMSSIYSYVITHILIVTNREPFADSLHKTLHYVC